MPVPTALAFRSVTKRFRNGRMALREVSWSVARGTRTCLLGPNGAGKSTSIRILEGALRPTAGSAELLGQPVDGPGYADARLRTGVVPQGPGMYADLTAGEYLKLAARLYDELGDNNLPQPPWQDRFGANAAANFERFRTICRTASTT